MEEFEPSRARRAAAAGVTADDAAHAHSLEAERAVLGACLALGTETVKRYREILPVADPFYLPRHGSIWFCLLSLVDDGTMPDVPTVKDRMPKFQPNWKLGFDDIYLTELYGQAPYAFNPEHARIVAADAKTRRVAEVLVRAKQRLDEGADLSTVVDDLADLDSLGGTTEDGWTPVRLEPYVDGSVVPPVPEVGLQRTDGLQILYPGREHAVIGEMEAGKTWFAAMSTAAELGRARHVLYLHFEENEPADLVGRLLALGVSKPAITSQLVFVAPNRKVGRGALSRLLSPPPSLVVIDGVNEAMSLNGWAIREEDGAAQFRRHLVMPCLGVGAATLACDHVVKDADKRGRYALGSIHKGNGLNGALILLENAEPFGRDARGRSHVYVTKDRPGHLRRKGQPTKVAGRTFIGTLIVDHSEHRPLDAAFHPPRESTEVPTSPNDDLDRNIIAAVATITQSGQHANLRKVRAEVGGSKDKIDQALARLTNQGLLVETRRGQSRVFTVAESVAE